MPRKHIHTHAQDVAVKTVFFAAASAAASPALTAAQRAQGVMPQELAVKEAAVCTSVVHRNLVGARAVRCRQLC